MLLSEDPATRLSQLQAIKQYVITNHNGVFEQSTVNAMNADSTFNVYRTEVTRTEVLVNGFDWTRLDNLSVGKARIWQDLTNSRVVNGEGVFNPSKSNVREGINEVWKGTTADVLVRDVVYTHCYRLATLAEELLATGTGTAPVAGGLGEGPGTMGDGAEGDITIQNLIEADGVALP